MASPIKYSTTTQSQSLRLGNFWFGTNSDKGPSTTTGYYNGVTPATNGYTIYLYKSDSTTGQLAYNSCNSDAELIDFTNKISGQNFSTAASCLAWYKTQSDVICVNRDFDPITSNGLVAYVDAGDVSSYPRSGLTWSDISGVGTNGILVNGPSYSTNLMYFDGVDDFVTFPNAATYSSWTLNVWTKPTLLTTPIGSQNIFSIHASGSTPFNNNEGYLNATLAIYYNISSIAVDAAGSIYVGGQFAGAQDITRGYFVKFGSTGTVDTNFDLGFGFSGVSNATGEAFTFDSNGTIYISGVNIGNMGVCRIGATAGNLISQPLAGAGGGGQSITNGGTLIDESAGKLWLYGHWATSYNGTSRQYITKVNISDYSIDTTFDTSSGFNSNEIWSAFIDAGKSIYLAGNFTQYKSATASRIVKINGTSSVVDSSFSTGTGFNLVVYKIALTSDGKIMAAGNFTSYNGTSVNRVVKLNTDGTIDATFSIGTGFNGYVSSFDVQSDGKIVFVGAFTSYNGTSVYRIVRLNTNGSIDSTFTTNNGTGFNITTNTVKVQSDGKILVGVGYTFTYNNQITTSGLLRLNSDGTLDTGFNIGSGINLALYRDFIQGRISGNSYQLFAFSPYSGNNGRIPPSSAFPPFDTYRLYTTAFDSSTKTIKFYLDGAIKATASTTGLVPMNAQLTTFVGSGLVGSVTLYNRELISSEILQTYNVQRSNFLLEVEYLAILAEGTAQGWTLPSADQQIKQNTFIKSLKSSGVWNKADLILVLANNGSKEFSCINWKNPTGTKATLVNSPTWTSNAGFTGDGVSSYILTGLSTSGSGNYKLNDASRYAYLKVNVANRIIDGNVANIANSMTTFVSTFQRINQSGSNLSVSIDYSGVGMKSIHRTSSIDVSCYNDTILTKTTGSSTGITNDAQCILRSASGYGTHQVSFYLMGASLTGENSTLVSAFSTYLNSL